MADIKSRIEEIAQALSIVEDQLSYWISALYNIAEGNDENDKARPPEPGFDDEFDDDDACRTIVERFSDNDKAAGRLAMLLGVSNKAAKDKNEKEETAAHSI